MTDTKAPHGVTLFEAMAKWGDSKAAQEMIALRSEGHYGPRVWGIPEGPPSSKDQKYLRHGQLRERLESEILAKLQNGEITATGYDSRDRLDSKPVRIPSDRWRVLDVDFDESMATAVGCTITGIYVYEGKDPETGKADRTAGIYSPADLKTWFIGYVAEHVKAGTAPSLGANWEAAKKEVGYDVPRDAVRKLRKNHAPKHWKQKGRRKLAK